MIIPTFVLTVLLITLIVCLQLNLKDSCLSDKYKLDNVQKINITLIIIVLCYICLFIGKAVL